jgi:replicative DNA helicase
VVIRLLSVTCGAGIPTSTTTTLCPEHGAPAISKSVAARSFGSKGAPVSIAHLGLAPEAERQRDGWQGERTPPHDLLAEQSAIGGMLLSKDAVADVLEAVRSVDFYIPKHEIIFDAILTLYSHGEPTDVIAVTDELTKSGNLQRAGGPEYLHTLTGLVPTAANAGYYASIVAEKAVLRRLVEAGTRIVQMGYASEGEVTDLVNNAQAEIYGVAGGVEAEDYVPLVQAIEAATEEIEHASGRDGSMTGVPTGFTELDQLTNGLHPGQLILIAARPALGKSTLALDFARAAAITNDMPAIFFSLEMGRSEIAMRLLSAESNIFLQKLRKGDVRSDDWTTLASTRGRIADAPLYIDDSPNMTLVEIRAKCRRLKQKAGLKLIVIDYLQLMTSGKRVESRQQEVSEFSRALKLLAKELQVPVIALSQLNRGPEQRVDKKPALSDLRESGSLEQDADMVILLHRESAYEKESSRPGEADLIIAKHRNGPTGTVTVAFQGAFSRFADMAPA